MPGLSSIFYFVDSGMSEPLLLTYAVSTKISIAGLFIQ